MNIHDNAPLRMQFIVLATDTPGSLAVRERVRPDHRLYLRQSGPDGARVILAGPTLEHVDGKMNGTMLVVEAHSLECVASLLAGDPYSRAGLFKSIEIRPWVCGLGSIDMQTTSPTIGGHGRIK